MRRAFPAAGLLLLLAAPAGLAQSSPFVDEKTERLLVNELSGDQAFEHMRITTQWHKPGGSEGFFAVARYVFEKAKLAGLEDVRWIDQKAESLSWTCRSGEAWLVDGTGAEAKETKIASVAAVATSVADYSRPTNVTADLVDVGAGDRAADYRGKDVKGKIVLAYGSPATVMDQAVWKRGAAGILSWSSTRLNALSDFPDQVAWQRVPEKDGPKGEKTTFAVILSARAGKALSDRLKGEADRRIFSPEAGASSSSKRLRARVVIDSVTLPENKTAMVEGRIRGSDASLPEIVLTAHLQESKPSANDDQSGVASLLEIGRTLSRLVAEGKIPRPRRGIRFWWADEIYSEYRYFADHPGEEKKVLANLNQDMVGARQSLGGRVQHMTRTPWVRPSYLPDVQQSILEMVALGNTGYLPAFQAQSDSSRCPVHETDLFRARLPRAVPRARDPLLLEYRPHGLQRLVGRRAGHDADELAGRVHPLLRRRPLAGRSDAARAQRIHRRRDSPVARERRSARGGVSRLARRRTRDRAPRIGLRDRPGADRVLDPPARRGLPRRGEPARGVRREGVRGDRLRARARSGRRRNASFARRAPRTGFPRAAGPSRGRLPGALRRKCAIGSAPRDGNHRRETRAETRRRDSRRVDGAPGEGPRAARGRGATAAGRPGVGRGRPRPRAGDARRPDRRPRRPKAPFPLSCSSRS